MTRRKNGSPSGTRRARRSDAEGVRIAEAARRAAAEAEAAAKERTEAPAETEALRAPAAEAPRTDEAAGETAPAPSESTADERSSAPADPADDPAKEAPASVISAAAEENLPEPKAETVPDAEPESAPEAGPKAGAEAHGTAAEEAPATPEPIEPIEPNETVGTQESAPEGAPAAEPAPASPESPKPRRDVLIIPSAERRLAKASAHSESARKAEGDAAPKPEPVRKDAEPQARKSASPDPAALAFGRVPAVAAAFLLSAAALSFAAANWVGWSPALRLAAFGGAALLAFLPAAFVRNLTPAVTDRFAAAGGLLTALLMAVIGQTWQTGEGAASLLLSLSLLMTPWAAAVRRPLTGSLWFASLTAGLLLEGFARFDGGAEFFAALLPATAFALLAALISSAALRLRPQMSGLRAAALLPALAFAVLAGAVAPTGVALRMGGLAGLPVLYLAGAALGSAALALTRLPEHRSLAALVALGWFNAFLCLAFPEVGPHLSGSSLIYALALVNGVAFLAAVPLVRRLRARRGSRSGAEGTHAETGALDRWARRIPVVAVGTVGAVAALLAAVSVAILLGVDASAGWLLAAGLLLGAFLRVRDLRSGEDRPVTALSATLAALALLACASGWLVVVSGQPSPAESAGLVAAALLAAVVFPWRIVLFLALLSPCAAFSPEALREMPVLPSAAVFAAVAAAVLAVLAAPARTKPVAARLPAALAALWALMTIEPMLAFDRSAASPWPMDAVQFALPAAGVLLLALAALMSLRRFGLRHPETGRMAAALFACAAAAFAFPGAEAPILLSTAAAAALALARPDGAQNEPGRTSGVAAALLFGLALTAGDLYWASPLEGANVLLEAARTLALPGFALAAGAAALLGRRGFRPAPGLRPLPAAALLIVVLALGWSVLGRVSLLAEGTPVVLRLAPADPRDLLMGDFMTLDYEIDPDAASLVRAHRGEPGRIAGFCLAPDAEDAGSLTISKAVVRGAEDDAEAVCPAGTALELGAEGDLPRLPRRWFFPSGEAARHEAAVAAELRCRGRRCILARLIEGDGRPITPAEPRFD